VKASHVGVVSPEDSLMLRGVEPADGRLEDSARHSLIFLVGWKIGATFSLFFRVMISCDPEGVRRVAYKSLFLSYFLLFKCSAVDS